MYGTSTTKFTKGGLPKHAGNFSKLHTRWHVATYKVELIDGQLIVGNNTPLSKLMPDEVVWLATNDQHFKEYRQEGVHTFNDRQFKCEKTLTKDAICCDNNRTFTYRECIDTENYFTYNFPNY